MDSRPDYIDEDVAYLLGLLVAKGTWVESPPFVHIAIDFPFRAARLAGYDQFTSYLASVNAHVLPRLRNLLGEAVRLEHSERKVTLLITLPRGHMVLRNLMMLLSGTWPQSVDWVPEAVEGDTVLAAEFIRGYADAAGTARPSNRDQAGIHRVFLDVAHNKWPLGCRLCSLLQDVLGVPVQNILWSHPVLRGGPSHREHQLRIYAHAFVEIGFYLDMKQSLLETLAAANRANRAGPPSFCDGSIRRRTHAPRRVRRGLPPELAGRPVSHFTDVCAALGCARAIQARKS